MGMRRIPEKDLRELVERVLLAWGMPPTAANVAAESIIDTDLSGIDSHGVSMLALYERLVAEGRIKTTARPHLVLDRPSLAILDGDNGFGHPVGVEAIRIAVSKARNSGAGVVAVRNSNHFGALGYYVRLAVREGMIALCTTSTRVPVAASTGGAVPVLGTNPIAFAAPRLAGDPLVVDIATTVVAMNKVKAYALKGTDLPMGWVTNEEGHAVTNAGLAYELLASGRATISLLGGSSYETGGHKGMGLSLMAQILSSALSGAGSAGETGPTDNIGHFFLAIDLTHGGMQEVVGNVEGLLQKLERNATGLTLPGEPESRARRDRLENGIPLPDALLTQLGEICVRADVPFELLLTRN